MDRNHHVAYAVDDLAEAFRKLEDAEIPLTSKRIAHDPMSGLRQAFISRDKTGYFIELIERTEEAEEGIFKSGNMAELAVDEILHRRRRADGDCTGRGGR